MIIEDEVKHMLNEADREGICLRLLGGLAVKLHCEHNFRITIQRQNMDIDLVTDRAGGRNLGKLMSQMGYQPNQRFNTLNGDRRQLFDNLQKGIKVDVFIGDFEMCHLIPLTGRLKADPTTIPLAELFLSKAQIVELNQKDILDLILIFLNHDLGCGDQELINQSVIADLCGKDWGLYTTVTDNLQKTRIFLRDHNPGLDQNQTELIEKRLNQVEQVLKSTPKTLNWKMRARLGRRMRWYLEVEEVQR